MTTRSKKESFVALALILFAGTSPVLGCGGEGEGEDVQASVQPGYWRLQNTEAMFARRCVASGGVNAAVVGGAICSGLAENQGYTYDFAPTHLWLKTQGTGPAKCLAVNSAGALVNAVCAASTANQAWTRLQITGTARFTFANAGKCLSMVTDGALSVATCVPGQRNQEWIQGNDPTLVEALAGGGLNSHDVPTGAPDVVVPATAGTIAYTQNAITHWDLTYIKYQPTNVSFESRGIVAVGRDQWGAPRYYVRTLHIDDPRTPNDIHHTFTSILPDGTQTPQVLDINIVNGQPKTTVVNNVPSATAHSTAVAVLLRDVQAFRAASGFAPVTPPSAAAFAQAAGVRPIQDLVTQLAVSDIPGIVLSALDVLVVELGCPICGGIIATIPLIRKLFPDNPPGGTPTCGSKTTEVKGDTGQCVVTGRPAECPLPPVKTNNSCAVQNAHALPSTESHGQDFCTVKLPTGPGLSCSKSPIPPSNVLCHIDCVQTHASCGWAWCQIPPK
ncbi:MAG: hypothetical protein U1E65_02495 [Myxococcota bacterium]